MDVAVELARAADAGDRVALEIRARARTRGGRFLARWVEYERFLRLAKRPARLESIVACGRTVHGAGFVDGWVIECKDGVQRAVIVHEGLPLALVTRGENGARRRMGRLLACVVIRLVSLTARVVFTRARAANLPDWMEKLGRRRARGVTEPAPRARGRPYTHKGPHREGGAWFVKARLPRGAKLAEIVACEVDDGVKFGARGENAVGAMHARVGMGGYMYRSTTRYATTRGNADATVELPNKLIIADPRFDALVREGLDASELTAPGKIPDDVPSLAPWNQPEWRWVEVITRDALRLGGAACSSSRRCDRIALPTRASARTARCSRRTRSRGRTSSTAARRTSA